MDPVNLAALKVQIAEAEDAYHGFMCGKQIARFTDQNGETVQYTIGDKSRLYLYIQELKAKLPSTDTGYSGWPTPMRPFF